MPRVAALHRLADGRAVDPNDSQTWSGPNAHAKAVLLRHGITSVDVSRLASHAIRELIARQAEDDRKAGLDWATITTRVERLDDALRRAHARVAIDPDDPTVWSFEPDRRRALARRLSLDAAAGEQLSRWVLTHPDDFDADDLRCWQLASHAWLALADAQLEPVRRVERPVGVFLAPAPGGGWQLEPTFTLDAIRALASLGAKAS